MVKSMKMGSRLLSNKAQLPTKVNLVTLSTVLNCPEQGTVVKQGYSQDLLLFTVYIH